MDMLVASAKSNGALAGAMFWNAAHNDTVDWDGYNVQIQRPAYIQSGSALPGPTNLPPTMVSPEQAMAMTPDNRWVITFPHLSTPSSSSKRNANTDAMLHASYRQRTLSAFFATPGLTKYTAIYPQVAYDTKCIQQRPMPLEGNNSTSTALAAASDLHQLQ